MTALQPQNASSTATPEATNNATLMPSLASEKPSSSSNRVSPVLPPMSISLRLKASISAKVSAWVMIEKYTPVTRERNASQPKISASSPGARTTASAATGKWAKTPCQGASGACCAVR